ncbi:MAG: hypothetical protein K8R89_02910 [Anaerolineae bacterium]|nr:hypothetical protein [Anaerolineae bacterium]
MSDTAPLILRIVGSIIVLLAALIYLFWRRARQVNLTKTPPGEQPAWMRSQPPEETLAATEADGEGISLYDHDAGEYLAAPFAEQIEDIIHARLASDPTLSALEVDLGTASDGTLEIWVDGQCYTAIDQLPHAPLRKICQEAVAAWEGQR